MNTKSRAINVPEQPPSYEPVAEPQPKEALDAAFTALKLQESHSELLTADECLAHLKLLSAFRALKEDMGYTDGLFGLWDVRRDKVDEQGRTATLAKMREKRWALYVARAVDRFQTWWTKVICTARSRLKWKDMLTDSPSLGRFTEVKQRVRWTIEMLPPIDILMVWHTFMLNPRIYLEDCILFGLAELWAAGMPWYAVNNAIDNTSLLYSIPEEGRTEFRHKTGLYWSNAPDSMRKEISCPRCSAPPRYPGLPAQARMAA